MRVQQKGNISYSLVLLVVILALVAVGGAYALRRQNSHITKIVPKTLLGVTPAPSPIMDEKPLENTLYVGTYKGEQAIYIKGQIKTLGAAYQENYTQLTNVHRVTPSLDLPVEQINGINFDETKKYLYLSINLQTPEGTYPDNLVNKVYQIEQKSDSLTELWSNKIGSDKYPGSKGAAFVQRISPDREYVVLSLTNCYACEGTEYGLVVINTKTKQEKYLEKAKNVQFDLANKKFSYQGLSNGQILEEVLP